MASTYSIIGQPVPARVDGTGKVTGVTRYADDLFLPRMLYGKLLRSPHPHAHILSIDISKAAALANAVYDALGVRIEAISITPEKVLKALELRARGQEPRVGPKGIPAGSCPPLRKVERLEEWLQVVPDPGTKKMVRVYVARVLCQLADLPDTP